MGVQGAERRVCVMRSVRVQWACIGSAMGMQGVVCGVYRVCLKCVQWAFKGHVGCRVSCGVCCVMCVQCLVSVQWACDGCATDMWGAGYGVWCVCCVVWSVVCKKCV